MFWEHTGVFLGRREPHVPKTCGRAAYLRGQGRPSAAPPHHLRPGVHPLRRCLIFPVPQLRVPAWSRSAPKPAPASPPSPRSLRSPAPHRLGVALAWRRLHCSVLHRPCVSPPGAKIRPGAASASAVARPHQPRGRTTCHGRVSFSLKICH